MEDFKITLFESEHKLSFPEFKTLTESECQKLIKKLSEKYSLVGNDIDVELASKQTFYDKANTTENFELIGTLTDLGINPMASSRKVGINSLLVLSHHRTCRSAYGGSLNINSFQQGCNVF